MPEEENTDRPASALRTHCRHLQASRLEGNKSASHSVALTEQDRVFMRRALRVALAMSSKDIVIAATGASTVAIQAHSCTAKYDARRPSHIPLGCAPTGAGTQGREGIGMPEAHELALLSLTSLPTPFDRADSGWAR